MKEVLIVDDEQQMLIALNETLKRKGYAITTAGNGADALAKLENKFYDAVITDVRMPGLDGMDLLNEVKRLSPAIPVIMLTGHGTVTDAVKALKQGAFDYLIKPFSAQQLTEALARATQHVSGQDQDQQQIVTQDPKLKEILSLAGQAAHSDATVLIQAESGTGKELVARYIHACSERRDRSFVAVNCAALPDDLLESELFGHEKGAFTGALEKKAGRFEVAHRGTILLDEIGEMAPRLQAKLLRVLQEREIDRVGGLHPLPVDVRVIATTNRNLQEAVSEGKFREDLFYRLNVIPLSIPPLRSRRGDIPLLVGYFCEKYRSPGQKQTFSEEAVEMLQRHRWPGNVRELENVTRRVLAFCKNPIVSPADLFIQLEESSAQPSPLKAGVSLKEMERQMIRVTLDETGGNRTRAAEMLDISLRALRNKLREYREAGEVL